MNKAKKGFTLIELLVVIAILGVLATAVILVINPAELIRQARDSTRISDLANINRAISLYLTDVATPYLGGIGNACTNGAAVCTSGTTEYFSATTSCVTAAAASTTVNGSGWVTIDFADISSGSPISRLPFDPNNGATTGECADATSGACFYSYGCSGTNYELNAIMESVKYSNGQAGDVESKDGGNEPNVYEVGNKLDL
ncbi:MAG TPA: type II secretion system protein [Candidatus Paceibacterota bacterium]|nr:type II secretion system protein [Candidatus Paceibacterota bacterium]